MPTATHMSKKLLRTLYAPSRQRMTIMASMSCSGSLRIRAKHLADDIAEGQQEQVA